MRQVARCVLRLCAAELGGVFLGLVLVAAWFCLSELANCGAR